MQLDAKPMDELAEWEQEASKRPRCCGQAHGHGSVLVHNTVDHKPEIPSELGLHGDVVIRITQV